MIKRSISLLLAVLCLSVLASCDNLIKLKYENGRYVDAMNGVAYVSAPVCFEPEAVGEAYAQYDKTVLYQISGLDPKEWLTEQYEGIGSVYCSEKIDIPDIQSFGADFAYICVSDVLTMQIGEISDKSAVEEIVRLYAEGEEVALPTDGTASYHIKFSSELYPSIFYDVLYVEHDSQHNYLYDRSTKKCVDIGRALKSYLPSDEDLTGSL